MSALLPGLSDVVFRQANLCPPDVCANLAMWGWRDQGTSRGHPAKMVCQWGAGGGRNHLGYACSARQAAVNSSRSLYIRRYRCSAGVRRSVRSNLGRSRRKDRWLVAATGTGRKVADIGCGTGQSTFIMARAFPNSTFIGYDFHAPSIEHAAAYARTNGAENVRFEVAKAKDFPARDLDPGDML